MRTAGVTGPVFTTAELAERLGARLVGAPTVSLSGLAPIDAAGPGQLTHLSSPTYRGRLSSTGASAVLLREADLDLATCAALVVADPYLAYARASQLFERAPPVAEGRHETATIAADAVLGQDVHLGAGARVGAGARLADGCRIGPNAVIGAQACLGAGCRVHAGAVLAHGVVLGAGCVIHAGAVIGADGFGFARGPEGAERIAQLGGVVLGEAVEVGAGSTIDRGALGDTRIGDRVKIDNQVQIGHNVTVGEDTLICGCCGIVGSSRIGARCVLAGGVGVGGDGPVTIADDCVVSGMSFVSRSLPEPGTYSSGTLIQPTRRWKRSALQARDLDALVRRVADLERALAEATTSADTVMDAASKDST